MKPIEKYIEALENRDYNELSELFCSDGHYADYCPGKAGQPDYHLYGKEAINMFFRNRFMVCEYSIQEPQVINPRQCEFVAVFNGFHIVALANLQQLTEDGHIRRLTVRPK